MDRTCNAIPMQNSSTGSLGRRASAILTGEISIHRRDRGSTIGTQRRSGGHAGAHLYKRTTRWYDLQHTCVAMAHHASAAEAMQSGYDSVPRWLCLRMGCATRFADCSGRNTNGAYRPGEESERIPYSAAGPGTPVNEQSIGALKHGRHSQGTHAYVTDTRRAWPSSAVIIGGYSGSSGAGTAGLRRLVCSGTKPPITRGAVAGRPVKAR